MIMKTKTLIYTLLVGSLMTSCQDRDMSSDTPKLYVHSNGTTKSGLSTFDISTYTIDPQTGVITATTIGGNEIISSNYTIRK